jgi:hypothetical protein
MSSRRSQSALLAMALGLWGGAVAFAQAPAATVEGLMREAQLVFRGTVVRPGAANLMVIKAGEDTAVVRVDELIHVPGKLEIYAGQEVTVKLRQPGSVKAGDTAVFFTRSWLYGEHLAVVEVGRTAPGAAVASQVAAARRKMADEDLRHRLEGAALVVAGRVVATRPAVFPDKRGDKGRDTEHDPQWQEAVIAVDRVLKGQLGESRAVVLYPGSDDILWFRTPKPQVGWDGVWILEPSPLVEGSLILPKAESFLSRQSLAKIEAMVEGMVKP